MGGGKCTRVKQIVGWAVISNCALLTLLIFFHFTIIYNDIGYTMLQLGKPDCGCMVTIGYCITYFHFLLVGHLRVKHISLSQDDNTAKKVLRLVSSHSNTCLSDT